VSLILDIFVDVDRPHPQRMEVRVSTSGLLMRESEVAAPDK
jgi:hypothetical protein